VCNVYDDLENNVLCKQPAVIGNLFLINSFKYLH
jgi:hypothetical protein